MNKAVTMTGVEMTQIVADVVASQEGWPSGCLIQTNIEVNMLTQTIQQVTVSMLEEPKP